MDRRRRKQPKTEDSCCSEEVSSVEWECINMTEQEEDLIYRMYRLVGDSVLDFGIAEKISILSAGWALIAGRLPGRKPEEIERFWIMRHGQVFATTSRHRRRQSPNVQ